MPRTALSLTLEERAWPCLANVTKDEVLCCSYLLPWPCNEFSQKNMRCPDMAANPAQLNWLSQGNFVSGIWVQSVKGSNGFEWVIFVLLLWTNSASVNSLKVRREGGIGLLVAPDIASGLLTALPESRQADLYSDHPQNKCQNIKGKMQGVL